MLLLQWNPKNVFRDSRSVQLTIPHTGKHSRFYPTQNLEKKTQILETRKGKVPFLPPLTSSDQQDKVEQANGCKALLPPVERHMADHLNA